MHLEDFIKLNNEDGRTLVKEFDLFYLYHNEIDKIGDDSASEHKVFGAVKRTQETLIQALKRITAFNGNNILITSDHGFLYQQKELNESDFVEVKVEGDEVWKQARRFIIGKALKTNKSMWCVNSDELGMEGNLDFQFPRSISRLKKTGAGKQFVHGGTSLQEVVVPCIVIKKKRVSDIKQVNISILNPQKIITTNQVTISFYQDEPVSTKVLKRKIKAAFYDIKGDLISEIHEITFDIEASESELRVKKQTFVFNPSLENDLECELEISSKVEGSNQFVPYEQYPHHLKKTFDLDFKMNLEALDKKINQFFAGKVVRKDLTKAVKGNSVVPSFVLEYLLGQYCATDDEDSINSGIERVKKILGEHFVHRKRVQSHSIPNSGKGQHRVIDKVSIELNPSKDIYEASFFNLGLKKISIDSDFARKHPKLLVGGIWCIVDIEYEATDEAGTKPWVISSLKPIQVSSFDEDQYIQSRKEFTTEEWINLLIQSVGLNPDKLNRRGKYLQLLRLIPFCERNYNLIELGPKGTGKSHVFSEFSPHGILISGGEITVAKLFCEQSKR